MYFYDGKHVPGVTTILSAISKGDAITQWAVNQTVDYLQSQLVGDLTTDEVGLLLYTSKYAWKARRDEAATIGTLAHNWIEDHLTGNHRPLPEDESARKSCEAALKWMEDHHWQTVSVEDRIFSPTHWYAGTGDWLVYIDGELTVADWKTSKSLHNSYRYQTAAYVKAIEELTGQHIPNRRLLRIDKQTGEFEELPMDRDSLDADFNTFLAARTIWQRENELNRRRTH